MPREKERNKSVYRIRDKRIYIIRYEEYMRAIHSTRENDDKRKERGRFDPVLIVRINIIIGKNEQNVRFLNISNLFNGVEYRGTKNRKRREKDRQR